jgi:hypothetical protein
VQSPPKLHGEPTLQRGHAPPQSVSVSVPFLTPSVQVGAAQMAVVSQTPLAQSVSRMQPAPAAQREHVTPPQSMPVSLPFCVPSAQSGVVHNPPEQNRRTQSPPTPQPAPLGHPEQKPPQSTSVSVPF